MEREKPFQQTSQEAKENDKSEEPKREEKKLTDEEAVDIAWKLAQGEATEEEVILAREDVRKRYSEPKP